MKVGTLEENLAAQQAAKKALGLGGPSMPSGGRKDGDGGSDDGGAMDEPAYEKSFSKSKIFTWFLLIVVVMTFGGLIGAYIVIATNGVLEWRPFNLPFQVYLSTILILAGSVTYSVAQKAINRDDHHKSRTWLIVTTVLGGLFISSQLISWVILVNRGFYMQSNPYAAFFYLMTALHAVHVIGGVIALGYVVLRNWLPSRSEKERSERRESAAAVAWYWHFMGGLWCVLLLLLGFWK